jgi:hypothetical protein
MKRKLLIGSALTILILVVPNAQPEASGSSDAPPLEQTVDVQQVPDISPSK